MIVYRFLSVRRIVQHRRTVNFEPASTRRFIRKIKQTTGENEARVFERVINIIARGDRNGRGDAFNETRIALFFKRREKTEKSISTAITPLALLRLSDNVKYPHPRGFVFLFLSFFFSPRRSIHFTMRRPSREEGIGSYRSRRGLFVSCQTLGRREELDRT